MGDIPKLQSAFPGLAAAGEARASTAARSGVVKTLDQSFYFLMSLLIAATVVYGFSHTINNNLLHPSSPRPAILYFHAALFTGWLVLLIVQSALVRTRNVKVHRKLGWFGMALGVAMVIVGIATAILMARFRVRENVGADDVQFMIVPFFDMLCFGTALALAFYWRKRPEFHRRMMLIASCALTSAAFGRFPPAILPLTWSYAGVDALVFIGVARDLIVTRRIHPVYLYWLPPVMLAQTAVIYTYVHSLPVWMKIAHAILG